MRTRTKWCLGCGGAAFIALLLFVAVYALLILGFRKFIELGQLVPPTAEERAEMERFYDEPVEVPQAWKRVHPVPEEVERLGERICGEFPGISRELFPERLQDLSTTIRLGKALTDEEWEEAAGLVGEYRGFTDLVSQISAVPGFEFSMLPSCSDEFEGPNVLFGNALLTLLPMQASVQARRGEWADAFETCRVLLRLGQRHPGGHVYIHRFSLSCVESMAETVGRIVTDCTNADLLRAFLGDINARSDEIQLGALDDPMFLNIVAELRFLKEKGEDVDLDSVKPRIYFWRQLVRIQEERGEIPLFNYGTWRKFMRIPGFRRPVEEMYIDSDWEFASDYHAVVEKQVKAEFDLARFALASRIEELETGRPAGDMSALVEKYLPNGLTDPFADAAYRRDTETETVYSIGPDRADNQAKISYDPTNGTVSGGDILLPGRAAGNGN
jgi:hypothetical protein